MKALLCPHRAENKLIKQQRPLREIRAVRKAIDMMNKGPHTWGYSSNNDWLGNGLLVEVWSWKALFTNKINFSLRIVDNESERIIKFPPVEETYDS